MADKGLTSGIEGQEHLTAREDYPQQGRFREED